MVVVPGVLETPEDANVADVAPKTPLILTVRLFPFSDTQVYEVTVSGGVVSQGEPSIDNHL